MIMVQGDTSSAIGGARAAQRCEVPLAHVEAGLRTFDASLPWPEEQFRLEIDHISDLLFAPTDTARLNLRREHIESEIHVTGNSGIDALLGKLSLMPSVRSRTPRRPFRLLVTCHRREQWGEGLAALANALITLATAGDALIRIVLHPNLEVAGTMWSLLGGQPNIRLIAPLAHSTMIDEMRRADLILSDSGGIQEEAPALGIPLLVLRDKTERPECIASGNARMVGTDSRALIAAVRELLYDHEALAAMSISRFPFGDGRAAPRIAALSLAWLDARRHDDRAKQSRSA